MSTLLALATTRPAAPHLLRAEVPVRVSEFVLTLLAKDRDERPATARDVAAALEGLTRPPRQRVPPGWKRAAAVAALGLAVVAAAVVVTLQTDRGTLIVTVPEAGVHVYVDGERKVILDSATVGKIELVTGEHGLEVRRGEEVLFTDSFTLARGRETKVEAKWRPRAAAQPEPLAVRLFPGKRAKSIEFKTDRANAGFILPGARVDVFAVTPAHAAKLVVENARVLAVDSRARHEPPGGGQAITVTVTLEVTPGESFTLADAAAQGEFRVALRPFKPTEPVLGAGKRAMSFKTNVQSMAGGFILPESHVDVIVTPWGPQAKSRIVSQNVRVLAVDLSPLAPGQKEDGLRPVTATLELTPQEAAEFAAAVGQGVTQMILRPQAEKQNSQKPLQETVAPGKRAVSIPLGSMDRAATVLLMPGVRVDVATVGKRGESNGMEALLVEDVRILATDCVPAHPDAPWAVQLCDVTATLEVTPEQALKLAEARAVGPFRLALRRQKHEPRRLAPGKIALAVPTNVHSAVGGFVLPGNHIDVIVVSQPDDRESKARVVLKNVLVLAVDWPSRRPTERGTELRPVVVTLEVSKEEAQAWEAREKGVTQLLLRPQPQEDTHQAAPARRQEP